MPFAGFDSFDACMLHMKEKEGYSEDVAKKVCGTLQAKSEAKRANSVGTQHRELRFNFSTGKFQELNGGLLVKDVPFLLEGIWTDSNVRTPLYYPAKTLQKYFDNWVSDTIWARHNGGVPRSVIDKVGKIENRRFASVQTPEGIKQGGIGDLRFHGKTQVGRDTIELIKAGEINYVSVEHGGIETWNPDTKRLESTELVFGGIAVVDKGACTVCTIQNEAITGDVRQLAEYTKDQMKDMLGFMKAHPEMMDDEMKGMMKGMTGGKEMSSSLSAEAEIMEMKELEAKLTETERQLAESTKNVTTLQGTVKELQDASVGKDTKIVEFERQLGEHKKLTEDTARQLGEAVQRIEKIEKTPVPQTVITGNGGFQLGSVPVYNPIVVKNGEISLEMI